MAWNRFRSVLYYTALFLALLLASMPCVFCEHRSLFPAWAYSFPLAALTIATLIMSVRPAGPIFTLGIGLLALVSLVVATLTIKTLMAVGRRQNLRPGMECPTHHSCCFTSPCMRYCT